MSSFDLLDIYEILIQIRFSIDTDESQQLISLLFDALHLKLGKLLHNQNVDDKFIREYILDNCEFGKTDYNLNIVRPPIYEEESEEDDE